MTQEELNSCCRQYMLSVLTYEEYHSMGLDGFQEYVKKHIIPIPKSELVIGEEYCGYCRNAERAKWDGEKFHYQRIKFGMSFDEKINHYEDDNGMDVFVPIREV